MPIRKIKASVVNFSHLPHYVEGSSGQEHIHQLVLVFRVPQPHDGITQQTQATYYVATELGEEVHCKKPKLLMHTLCQHGSLEGEIRERTAKVR